MSRVTADNSGDPPYEGDYFKIELHISSMGVISDVDVPPEPRLWSVKLSFNRKTGASDIIAYYTSWRRHVLELVKDLLPQIMAPGIDQVGLAKEMLDMFGEDNLGRFLLLLGEFKDKIFRRAILTGNMEIADTLRLKLDEESYFKLDTSKTSVILPKTVIQYTNTRLMMTLADLHAVTKSIHDSKLQNVTDHVIKELLEAVQCEFNTVTERFHADPELLHTCLSGGDILPSPVRTTECPQITVQISVKSVEMLKNIGSRVRPSGDCELGSLWQDLSSEVGSGRGSEAS